MLTLVVWLGFLLLADSVYLPNNLEFESLSRSGSHHR